MNAAYTALGFDYGLRRIGVAAGQSLTGTASEIAVVANRDDGPDWAHIDRLIAEWRPTRLVVGRPAGADGSDSEFATHSRGFAKALAARYNLDVAEHNEHLTSLSADMLISESRGQGKAIKKKRLAQRDAVAARLILEGYLAEH